MYLYIFCGTVIRYMCTMVNGQMKIINLSNSSSTITSMCWEPLSVTHILSSHGRLTWNQRFCFPGLSPTILSIHLKKKWCSVVLLELFHEKEQKVGWGWAQGRLYLKVSKHHHHPDHQMPREEDYRLACACIPEPSALLSFISDQ